MINSQKNNFICYRYHITVSLTLMMVTTETLSTDVTHWFKFLFQWTAISHHKLSDYYYCYVFMF